jgi:hypothetical protein
MSNVEKRKQLMSQADKRYFGHIQETIDRISRMKEIKQSAILSPNIPKIH